MSPRELPWVIPEYCEGCTACVTACRRGCIAMYSTAEDGVFIPWIEDPGRCTGCGLCAQGCVMGGIMMTSYIDDARARLRDYPAAAGLHKTLTPRIESAACPPGTSRR